jgi:intergrase/recombinase
LSGDTTLPNTVRSLPYIVRPPRQRSTSLSYQVSNDNSIDDKFWVKFQEYLLISHNKHTAKARLLYSKKYYQVLTEANAQELLILSNDKRIHAMKALAALSKYLGCYDLWKSIIERYQLKWSNEDAVQVFQNITNTDHDFSSMVKWLKDAYSQLSQSYGNILLFNALTGLRPEEAIQSIKILHNKESDNYLKDNTVLEHYKYPSIFIRRTKKAYISIVNGTILGLAREAADHSYNALRLSIKHKGLDMNMAFCRKIFATHLRNNRIEPEIIDLLQGRIPKSVFARHYFRPDFNHRNITECLISLHKSLIAS